MKKIVSVILCVCVLLALAIGVNADCTYESSSITATGTDSSVVKVQFTAGFDKANEWGREMWACVRIVEDLTSYTTCQKDSTPLVWGCTYDFNPWGCNAVNLTVYDKTLGTNDIADIKALVDKGGEFEGKYLIVWLEETTGCTPGNGTMDFLLDSTREWAPLPANSFTEEGISDKLLLELYHVEPSPNTADGTLCAVVVAVAALSLAGVCFAKKH